MKRIETSAFTLQEHQDADNRSLVKLRGELDLGVAMEVRELLEAQVRSGRAVVIDLSGLEFVDSTGLSSLMRAVTLATETGADVALVGPIHGQVRRIFRLTGADQFLRDPDA